jgi:SAM-dependent methyltransferase
MVFTDARNAPPPDKLYPAFDQTKSASMEGVRSALRVFLRQRARLVRKAIPAGRLLDYGCGNGAFAAHMAGLGYEAVGLEPFSLGEPLRGDRLTLLRAPLAEAAADLGTFDVITMWHVLEHVPDPKVVLAGLVPHLKPGGVLIISVPNFQSWQSTFFSGGWFHLDPPRHLLHFDASSLRKCLSDVRFEVTSETRFLPEYGSSGWVQSALNRVLPHENFLYEIAKDRGALASMSRGSIVAHAVASLALGVPLFALSIPVEALAAIRHAQAALTVCARRISG